MRLTPIKQEVRRTAFKGTGDEQQKGDYGRWLVLIAIYLFAVCITSPFYLYRPPTGNENQLLAQAPVEAWIPFRTVSQEKRSEWLRDRQKFHKRYYVYGATAGDKAIAALNELLRVADGLNPVTDEAEAMLDALRRKDARLEFLSQQNVGQFVELLQDPQFRNGISNLITDAYENHVIVERLTMYKGFQSDNVVEVVDRLSTLANRSEILKNPLPYPVDSAMWNPLLTRLVENFEPAEGDRVRSAAIMLLNAVIQPNLRYDENRSQQALAEYPRPDLTIPIPEGTELVPAEAKDRPLTAEEARLLEEHAIAVSHRHNIRLAGHAAYVLVVFLILSFYIYRFSREFAFTTYNIVLVALPVLIALTLQTAFILLAEGNYERVGYLFPAGAIGMLGVLLLEVRMGLLLVTWGCLLLGLQTDLNFEYVVVGIFGGYTAVAALSTIRKRWEVFLASILIGVVNAAVILIMSVIQQAGLQAITLAGLGLFSGISSFLVLAILPIFERFGIITDMQLLELTGLQHPLLRQIEELAPGTWQHTLNVTKLAEAAATEIGVNYLLVRAGCYYHDIGKVKKPEYFTENQITNEDKMRHAALKPIMSTLIIRNHVKEGVEMARAAKLPERIIDFIPQHHGTSVITYFYNKALEAQERGESKEPVRIDDYRYPGIKPQTIEAAIVMLADSVEATATAKLTGRSVRPDDIQQVVRTTILDKFNDGQFSECNLTLRDLDVIRETFVRVLKSRFHTRIDYPKKGGGPSSTTVKKKEKEREREKEREKEKEKEAVE